MENKENKNPVRKAWKKIKSMSANAIEKGKDFAGIAELRFKITMLERTNRTYYEDLGRLVFDLMKEKETGIHKKTPVIEQCKKILGIHEAMGELELEIKRIKAEFERDDDEYIEPEE